MLPVELPKDLARRAVQPPGLPDGEFAWFGHDALAVLAALEGSIVAVRHVEAYVVIFGHMEVTHAGRRATYTYEVGESAVHFAQRSRQLAHAFIDAGSSDELFVFVFSGQDDAEAGYGTFAVRAG